MAYMDDAAIEREQARQKMLANAPSIALGDPAQQQGVNLPALPSTAPQGSPFDAVMQVLGSLNLAPGGVSQTPGAPLQAPQVSPRISAPGSSTWKNDNSLGNALQGILGKGSALDQYMKRLQGSQAQPQAPGTPPQRLIPGLQPPIDANKAPPGTPAAKAYIQQQAPGPGVKGVERPPQGPSESSTLQSQRRDYASQLDANPALKEKFAAIMLAEEGGDPTARTALAESALNRGVSRGIPQLDSVLDPKYYQPMSDGSGNYEKALSRIRNDPQLKAQVYSDMERASHGGSNVSNLATDNASGQVARNSAGNQSHAWTAGNGEGFFRKDVRPDVHGAKAVSQTKDWYNNTVAAQVDEKPGTSAVASTAATAPQGTPPREPPGWFNKETLGTYGQPAAAAAPAPPPAQTPAQAPAAQPPPQAPAVTPQVPPQAPPPTPPQAPPAAPAPAAAAPPAAPTGINAAHQVLDTKVMDLVKRFAPEQAANVPGFIGDKTLRQAIDTPLVGGQVKSGIVPHLQKLGVSPADFEKAIAQPPGKRSDAGTSDATDFSARSRTPPGEPGAPLPPSGGFADTVQRTQPPSPDATATNMSIQPGGPPTAQQLTPEMAKAFVGAVRAEELAPPLPPQPGVQPVQLPDMGPPPTGLPGISGAPITSQGGAMTLAPGMSTSPMMMPGSQGNPIAMSGLAPAPVEQTPMSALMPGQTLPNALQPPIPFADMQGWGWNTGGGGWGGWSGGGFDGGLSDGFSMGGMGMMGGFGGGE
jgi:hypothetical protein